MLREHVFFRLVTGFKEWFESNFKEISAEWATAPLEVKHHLGSIWNFAMEMFHEKD
jgi:hypothetical protein